MSSDPPPATAAFDPTSDEDLRLLFASIPGVVLVVDPEGRILDINNVALPEARARVIGMSALDFVSPDQRLVVRAGLDQAIRTGKPASYEVFRVEEHGKQTWYMTDVAPLFRGGALIGLVLVNRDITDRKRLEEQAEAASAAFRALSVPILQVWEGVVALPVIGAVDEARAAQMMERLLDEIVRSQARTAILDLTGVAEVDAATADHLLRLVRAAALLGSRCLVSGVAPRVAQTMTELALGLEVLETFATLRDALRHALELAEPDRPPRRRGAR